MRKLKPITRVTIGVIFWSANFLIFAFNLMTLYNNINTRVSNLETMVVEMYLEDIPKS